MSILRDYSMSMTGMIRGTFGKAPNPIYEKLAVDL